MKFKEPFSSEYDMYFEPANTITNEREFTDELVKHFADENKCLTFFEESMEPVVEIDDVKYICKLGEPLRAWKIFKTPINPVSDRFLGYKWVYMYKI